MKNRQNDPTGNYQKASNGKFGHRFITAGETSPAGEFYVLIEAWADSTVSYESKPNSNDPTMDNGTFGGERSQSALEMTEGKTIGGSITNVEVTSGTILAYLN